MPHIETERLEMITFTADMMEAIMNGTAQQEGKIPYQLATGWPMPVYKQFFAYKIERFRKYPAENEWEGIIVHKQDQRIIGDMGFKGGPNEDGVIDLGYSIVPSYQGKGYATEMGKAMVEWGRSNAAVQKVIATCHPENLASIRVLEKIGFHVTKQTEESIYWEY